MNDSIRQSDGCKQRSQGARPEWAPHPVTRGDSITKHLVLIADKGHRHGPVLLIVHHTRWPWALAVLGRPRTGTRHHEIMSCNMWVGVLLVRSRCEDLSTRLKGDGQKRRH